MAINIKPAMSKGGLCLWGTLQWILILSAALFKKKFGTAKGFTAQVVPVEPIENGYIGVNAGATVYIFCIFTFMQSQIHVYTLPDDEDGIKPPQTKPQREFVLATTLRTDSSCGFPVWQQ